eukprot:TRINITY_DN11826_c0_g1_i1.p1 TRINITY_DN11826_c0_g1~~TRINITY_DN11826_c0_g1_i1.p1  ORF type:complete len:371 (-),score=41.44 TRINITY_DN11826_c0_g1_i1:23-1135(-)
MEHRIDFETLETEEVITSRFPASFATTHCIKNPLPFKGSPLRHRVCFSRLCQKFTCVKSKSKSEEEDLEETVCIGESRASTRDDFSGSQSCENAEKLQTLKIEPCSIPLTAETRTDLGQLALILSEGAIPSCKSFVDFRGRDPSKKLLVLDLDETLIHCESYIAKKKETQGFTIVLLGDDGKELKGTLSIRSGAHEFLEKMSRSYNIVVFTAGTRDYAECVISFLDPQRRFIQKILSRDQCTTRPHALIKDLRIFRNYSLENLIIVDNKISSFSYHLSNGLWIRSFYGETDDKELGKLEPRLLSLAKEADVRPAILRLSGVCEAFEQFSKEILECEPQLIQQFSHLVMTCLLYTSPSPRDLSTSRMPSSA